MVVRRVDDGDRSPGRVEYLGIQLCGPPEQLLVRRMSALLVVMLRFAVLLAIAPEIVQCRFPEVRHVIHVAHPSVLRPQRTSMGVPGRRAIHDLHASLAWYTERRSPSRLHLLPDAHVPRPPLAAVLASIGPGWLCWEELR